MKRIVGVGLFGLGVLLLILAVGLPLYVAPNVRQLPYDLEPSTSVAEAPNATFLQVRAGAAEIESGTLRSTVEVLPQAKLTEEKMTGDDLAGEAVVWNVYQSVVRTDTNELISAYSTELAIDRRTGAAADWEGNWLEDGTEQPANYAGQVYKFPFGTEQKSYPVYDRDIKRAVPAEFKRVTTVRGVEVYEFEQTIAEEPIYVAPSSLQVLLSRFAPDATGGEVVYRNTRTFWVEPTTGMYVAQRDRPYKALVPDNGDAPTVLLDADFTYDEETAVASANRASDNASRLRLVSLWLPLVLGLLGLLALIVGAVLALGGRRPPTPRHRQIDDDPPPADDEPVTVAAPADRSVEDTLPLDEPTVPNQRQGAERPAAH